MSRILVVEDDKLSRRLLHVVLEHAGHEVVESATVLDALGCIRQSLPDIIVTDLRLPDGRGEALLATVRAMPGATDVLVMVVTASAMVGERERLVALGFDAYASKPVNLDAFDRAVDELAATARLRSRAREEARVAPRSNSVPPGSKRS
jgi:two-component system cell cycle response regulator